MSNVPANLKFLKSHEWARVESDGTVTVGISDFAQEKLGDLVFVEVPETGRKLTRGQDCAVVESVKTAADVYTPLSGEVVARNESLTQSPELVNQEPYGSGWLFKIKPSSPAELEGLLDAAAYSQLVAEQH